MPPRRRRRPLPWLFLSTLGLAYVAYGAAAGNHSSSSLRRHTPAALSAATITLLTSSSTTTDETDGDKKSWDDKVVLLNDLSLEQAYLHHAAAGRLGEQEGFTESLAQQAARLAAGAYDSDVGGAKGWVVRGVYQKLNSVAILATREAGRGCALAFRGSDDRLDWRNDYRARPLPLILCSSTSSGQEEHLFFIDGPMGSGMGDLDRPGLRHCQRRLGVHTVHYGFYDSFRLLSHGTMLEEDWRALLRNGTCDPSVALMTGHSLGGAFVVFAQILKWPGIPITFAAPRAVANGSCPHPPPDGGYPITRIYLTDDPVPATLPMSDSLRVPGVGEPWTHCGCALALQAYYKPPPEETPAQPDNDDETFAAVSMGCGSNAPLRAREGPGALLLPPPPGTDTIDPANRGPSLLALPPLPPPPPPLPPLQTQKKKNKASAQPGIRRHLHTRYVKAMDQACQGPLDSPRCVFDHEVA